MDELSERYRSNFLSIISHELNTPLMGMLGSIQMLEEAFPGESLYIPILRKNAERLRERVNNLLELSRADAGALRVRLSEVDFENFLFIHKDLLKSRLESAGFTFELDIESDFPRVCADARRMGKVFECLVLNAIKFSSAPKPGAPVPKIKVKLALESMSTIPRQYISPQQMAKTGLYIVVSVASSLPAIGERPENFEQLFEPFSPWRDVDTRAKEGLGVELALAREILLAHSGFIWAGEPEHSGEGWSLRFALPVLSREDELDLIIHNRLFSGFSTLEKVSLLMIQLLPTQGESVSIATLAQEIKSLLFRSSDALFTVPETGEALILMDDCDSENAKKVGQRLASSLQQSLPHASLVWSTATGPDDGADAAKLLSHARSHWRSSSGL
jgi:nitrogen-specific signal transduction histidine kinase